MEKEQEQRKRLKAEWEQKAESSLKLGDEGMAKNALSEKIRIEERIKNYEPSIKRSAEIYKQLRDSLAPLHDQLAEAKMKLSELGSRKQAAMAQKTFGDNSGKAPSLTVDGEHFEKMEEQVLQAESEVEIERELRGDTAGTETSLEKKTQQLQVDAELAKLKKRLGK